MASLWKRPDSQFWICCYTRSDGRRVKVSTGKTDREEALNECLAYSQAEQLAKRGVMTEARARKIIGEILERATGSGLSGFTAAQWLDEWLDAKRDGRSPKTLDRYEQVVRDFKASLGPTRSALSVEAITTKDILTYRRSVTADDRRSNKTANNAIKCLRTAFNAAVRLGHRTDNPCAALEDLSEDTAPRDTFTPEQVRKLVEAAESDDWKRAILFGYCTGARLGDVANLRWGMVDLAGGIVAFEPKKTKRKKISVTVPLHPALLAVLMESPGVGLAPVFPSLAGKGTGGVKGLSRQFADIIAAAKIARIETRHTKKGRRNMNLSFHSFRHTFTSALANAGVSPELRMKLTGHRSKDTHALYTHHEIEVLRAAVGKLVVG